MILEILEPISFPNLSHMYIYFHLVSIPSNDVVVLCGMKNNFLLFCLTYQFFRWTKLTLY